MKIAIWTCFAVTVALWTGLALVFAEGLEWASNGLHQGAGVGAWADLVSNWSVPTWLLMWVDSRDIHTLQLALATALEYLQKAWPDVGEAFKWLVPAVRFFWFLGVLVLLLLAGFGHWMVRLSAKPTRPNLPPTAT
jgi:hypothetical protein